MFNEQEAIEKRAKDISGYISESGWAKLLESDKKHYIKLANIEYAYWSKVFSQPSSEELYETIIKVIGDQHTSELVTNAILSLIPQGQYERIELKNPIKYSEYSCISYSAVEDFISALKSLAPEGVYKKKL